MSATIRIEKIHEKAIVPIKETSGSAGFDLTAVDYELVDNGTNGVVLFKTGLKLEIPAGFFGAIFPRSGLSKKGQWMLANGVGVIDADYRGEIMVMMRFVDSSRFFARQFNFTPYVNDILNTRIAQLILLNYKDMIYESVAKVSSSIRGTGGFGSTGR